jgi:outer membrane protein TolC
MDRSAWALSLMTVLVTSCEVAPCAAQPPAQSTAANNTSELLPALKPLNDPNAGLPRSPRPGSAMPSQPSRTSTSSRTCGNLLPVAPPRLSGIKDPYDDDSARAAHAESELAPGQTPVAAGGSVGVSTNAGPLCAAMWSIDQKWPAPDLSPSPPSGQPWGLPTTNSPKHLGRLWSSLSVLPRPALDPAMRRTSQTRTSVPALPTTPDTLAVKLRASPLESSDVALPINLATALRLSDARPLIVAAAQASVWVAEAQLTRAKVLWVPSFMFGFDYIRHDGGGPDINKGVMTVNTTNFFYGGGGFFGNVNLSDIIFQPLVARQTLNARQFDIQTAKNDALLKTADAYFNVHRFRGSYAGYLYAVERGRDLIERIEELSKDLVPKVEVDRARNFVADLEQSATSARELWRVHSADLTQVLRLDPRTIVVPLEHDHLQITLIDPDQSFNDLMRVAVVNRPELAAQRALVQVAETRIRQEKMRPILPTVMLNGFQAAGMYLQFGMFGLGPNSSLNQWAGRDDVSLQLMWQFDGMGIGNLARIKNQRGEESRAIIELFNTQDRVAAEVTRSLARLQSATARVSQAERALRTAIITFNGNFEGLKQTTRFEDVLVLVYRPQEAVYALDLMRLALDEYFATVSDYNRAQFELFHALGYPAAEIANRRPPGVVEPVNTTRPEFLPPVGNGPPPATR